MAPKPKKARQVTAEPEQLEEVEDETVKSPVHSRRGAKPLGQKKPKGSARFLVEAPIRTSRPINIYLEKVTDSESGVTGWFQWHTTEDSKTVGKEEISRINPRTEEEFTLGYDFTMPLRLNEFTKIWNDRYAKTKVYLKDGPSRSWLGEDVDPVKYVSELLKKRK